MTKYDDGGTAYWRFGPLEIFELLVHRTPRRKWMFSVTLVPTKTFFVLCVGPPELGEEAA